MTRSTILLLLFLSINATMYGQSSDEHLKSGIVNHDKQDYNAAIKDYTKAIKADKQNKEAYYNRGICELALKNFSKARADFDKTIKLDPENASAYYNRASVFASEKKYIESLPDLDKTIELDPKFPNALTLRGQIRAQSGNKKGACKDFNMAKSNGDPTADRYLSQFCGNEQQLGESLMLHWPEEENWKLGSSQEDGNIAMLELIHADETLENWTEIGSMLSIKGATNVPMDKAMNMMFDQSKEGSPKAKLTFIEKDESVEYPWIIFTIENVGSKKEKNVESQLWYIVQGKTALYTNFRAVKESALTSDIKDKWMKFFKTGEVVNK